MITGEKQFNNEIYTLKASQTLSISTSGSEVIDQEIINDISYKQNNIIFGKVLIDQVYPFGLIKFKDSDIKISENFICGSAKIKLLKPNWFE